MSGYFAPSARTIWQYSLLLFALLLSISTARADFTLNVVDGEGTPVSGFRWLLEEDTTYDTQPGVQTNDTLSLGFHRSYSPVVTKGETDSTSASVTAATDKRYYVSVVPYAGHTLSGAMVDIGETGTVTVVVDAHPIPTAQISVFVFEDYFPINGAPDLPQETPLSPTDLAKPENAGRLNPQNFRVLLEEAGGRYGHTGGAVTLDAFGNPIGTTYDNNGDILELGDSIIRPNENGVVVIKNLAPGKYGIQVIPPAGEGWIQTSTIEGSKTTDAWVAANEPSFFVEFGPPGHHVFMGFVKEFDSTPNNGGSTVTGQIVSHHLSRSPDYAFYNGDLFPSCWVGLTQGARGEALATMPCDDNSEFSFANVPAGDYTLVIWDTNLDAVIGYLAVTVPSDGSTVDLTEVPIFNWFAKLQSGVFFDRNENGFRDCVTADCTDPLQDDVALGADTTAVNIRFRNGTVYQSFPVDTEGLAPFDEIFPFFHWLVAEVDFATLKATGATYIVDAGGPVDPDDGWDHPSRDTLTPQIQDELNPNTGNFKSRTLTGEVLTLGMQGFLGQTNVIEWGKAPYGPGENGGISGLVLYAITRAEDNPQYGAAEEWEPGIPRVQVNLYRDMMKADGSFGYDKVIDDVNGNGEIELADVDNHPFGWIDGGAKGDEDIDHNGNGTFDYGDAVQITTTDSWDDSLPTNCQGSNNSALVADNACFDGLRNFNQIREGVFDGGYAFGSFLQRDGAGGIVGDFTTSPPTEVDGLPNGYYITEAALPPGYEHMKEEDRNVDFGDVFTQGPVPLLLPPECVGEMHTVPAYMSFQTQNDPPFAPLPGIPAGDLIEAPFAGEDKPLCNQKHISLTTGKNAAVDFFMFTDVPIAAHVVGGILNDLANEFDPNSPNFGEKMAPPWLPVSFRDWTGREISRVYADQWGKFNALVPSTYSVNLPFPTGVSPNMLTSCMNDASPKLVNGKLVKDPFHDPRFSQFCYTFQYMPGSTTYLDTPVVPISAFAGPDQFPLDCALPTQTPGIFSVSNIDTAEGGPYAELNDTVRVTSQGMVDVLNPDFDGNNAKNIARDYGFGANGANSKVFIGDYEVPAGDMSWSNDEIDITVTAATPSGQLVVQHDNGNRSTSGIYLTVGPIAGAVHHVTSTGTLTATPIQDAIDAASAGDLIIVAPGDYYEMVIMHTPVRLQGWGAAATTINAVRTPNAKLQAWRTRLNGLATGDNGYTKSFDLLPGQEINFNFTNNEPDLYGAEEGATILVVGDIGEFAGQGARIDGLSLTGANHGGGLLIGGYIQDLEVSNNWIYGNEGTFGGGIRSGFPVLTDEPDDGLIHTDAQNDNLNIHNNMVTQNGGQGGAGAGISLYTGSDNYQVMHNWVCGNFSQGHGAGIGHLGLNHNGVIAYNHVIFNQSFNQGLAKDGGGIYIGGQPGLDNAQSVGSGSVRIEANHIRGNLAGAGFGGGLRIFQANGKDVADNTGDPNQWFRIEVFDNIIVNNIAGRTGGGIAMKDAANMTIANNTVSFNESTSTVGVTVDPNDSNRSLPQKGAGIVAQEHSSDLAGDSGQDFSDPDMVNNILVHNRSYYWMTDGNPQQQTFGLVEDAAADDTDLAVLTGALFSDVRANLMTDASAYGGTNITKTVDVFEMAIPNQQPGQTLLLPESTTFPIIPALDEGGNFIDVRFGPLSLVNSGNYDLAAGSQAIDSGETSLLAVYTALAEDIYGTSRYQDAAIEIGAQEIPGVPGGPVDLPPEAMDDLIVINEDDQVAPFRNHIINLSQILNNDTNATGANLLSTAGNTNILNFGVNDTFTLRTPNDRNSVGTFSFTYEATNAGPTPSAAATVTLVKDIHVTRARLRIRGNGDRVWNIDGYTTEPRRTLVEIYLGADENGPLLDTTTVRNVQGRWFFRDRDGEDDEGYDAITIKIGDKVYRNVPLDRP